ncbi:MAG: GNAT family protein [Planctomycetota bacterium]
MKGTTPEPVTLAGRIVTLVPLTEGHVDALWEVGSDPEIWRWTGKTLRTREDMQAYVAEALRSRAAGSALPFATTLTETGQVVGSTRFGAIALEHRRVEIGWTWIAPPWQRTAVNTEAKLLMLTHAIEVLGCTRVELKTDALNDKSRRAIQRLGAKEEGILRKHMLTERGRMRDTVYYSLLDDEWPEAKRRLEGRLAQDGG